MKSLIVEDIPKTSDLIKNRITHVTKEIQSCDQAYSLTEARDLISKNNYDIVFWDVNMPNGTSFDLLKTLAEENKITFESIFITGEKESEYIIHALKFSAIDYLYKPVDDSELEEAIKKAIEKRIKSKDNEQMELLLEILSKKENEKKKVAFNLLKGNTVFINLEDITYLEADGVITKIHLNDKTILNANKNLGYYKSFLLEENIFFLISHSVIANVKEILTFNKKSLEIEFKNQSKVSVSRRKAKEFRTYIADNSDQTNLLKRILSFFK